MLASPARPARSRLHFRFQPLALALALPALPAMGQEHPAGCSGVSLSMTVEAYVDGAPHAGSVHTGQEMHILVTLRNDSPTACAYGGGQLSVTLPDGSFVALAGYPGTTEVPVVEFGAPMMFVTPVPYAADPADAVSGQLVATADYGATPSQPGQDNGTILTDPPVDAAAAAGSTVHDLVAACPADLDGDQTVGVLDLIAVVTGWGECDSPDEVCTSDVNGDHAVDVLDLIEVLTSWGGCGSSS